MRSAILFFAYFVVNNYLGFIHCNNAKPQKPLMHTKPVRVVRGAVGAVTGLVKGTIKGVPQVAVGTLGVAAGVASPYYHGGGSIAAGLGFIGLGIAAPFTHAKRNALKQ